MKAAKKPVSAPRHDPRSMAVGEYIEAKMADLAGNGDFGGGFGLSSANVARQFLEEFIAANDGIVPLRFSRRG